MGFEWKSFKRSLVLMLLASHYQLGGEILPPGDTLKHLVKSLVGITGQVQLPPNQLRPGMLHNIFCAQENLHHKELSITNINSEKVEKHYSRPALLQIQYIYESFGHLPKCRFWLGRANLGLAILHLYLAPSCWCHTSWSMDHSLSIRAMVHTTQ